MVVTTISDKSVVTFFSSGSCDAKWVPGVTLDGTLLKFDPAPRLLGVYVNRTLSFQSHVDKVVEKVEKRCRMLSCLTSTTWGWRKKSLRKIYLATMRSVRDFAAPSWQPWLSETQLKRLDTAQNQALRRITGQTSSSPLEALRLEAGLPSY